METARPFAPETRSSDRLRFGFRPDKPGKRPGFTDSTGEYRDTRTGWLAERDSDHNDAVEIRTTFQIFTKNWVPETLSERSPPACPCRRIELFPSCRVG